MINIHNSLSKCWYCKHAVRILKDEYRCPWAWFFAPVDGWNAEMKMCEDGTRTFNVIDCPHFLQDSDESFKDMMFYLAEKYLERQKDALGKLKHGILPKICKKK